VTSPYRDAELVLRTFELRTRLPWLEAYGLVALLLIVLFVFTLYTPVLLAAFVLVGVFAPLVLVPRLDRYRVAGGRGALRIFSDHVELPHAFRREPLRLALSELAVDVVSRQVWINGISFGETHMLVLATSDERRTLSSSLFASETEVRDAYLALLLARRGELAAADPEPAERRDAYDDMLDRELDQFDA
jgi:hypothetical protein